MSQFILHGGKPLSGEITVAGSKNAALPIIAASLLVEGTVLLRRVPHILDVEVLLGILQSLGATVSWNGNEVTLDTRGVKNEEPPAALVGSLRGSILLLGALLGRFRAVVMGYPGGDVIGVRPVDTHLAAFKEMGARVEVGEKIHIEGNHLRSARIILEETSVTGTENAILVGCAVLGTTEIRMAATEPSVQALIAFLHRAGATIRGAGTSWITIEGGKPLRGEIEFTLPADSIEAGTYAALAAATRSELLIHGVDSNELDALLLLLRKFDVHYRDYSDRLLIKKTKVLRAAKIQTGLYPKFPTDLQSPFGVVASQAQGVSLINDWMYENRLNYLNELKKMGANAEILDPHRAIVIGPTPLYGKEIHSLDIRSGIALVIAGLTASGKTIIHEAEKIDRGYERIEERLKRLGAEIERVE